MCVCAKCVVKVVGWLVGGSSSSARRISSNTLAPPSTTCKSSLQSFLDDRFDFPNNKCIGMKAAFMLLLGKLFRGIAWRNH